LATKSVEQTPRELEVFGTQFPLTLTAHVQFEGAWTTKVWVPTADWNVSFDVDSTPDAPVSDTAGVPEAVPPTGVMKI
jgi:hypothetical protein